MRHLQHSGDRRGAQTSTNKSKCSATAQAGQVLCTTFARMLFSMSFSCLAYVIRARKLPGTRRPSQPRKNTISSAVAAAIATHAATLRDVTTAVMLTA